MDFATGCALLVRRTAIAPSGLFDERYFFMGEDVDLSLRLAAAGQPLVYVPTAAVVHSVGTSSARQGQPFIWYHMTRNRLLTVAKHAHGMQKVHFYAVWPLLWAARGCCLPCKDSHRWHGPCGRACTIFAGRFGRRR
ncbi:MAG: glycosyltransferase family 2 protein [Anaerolineae bacterium]|nr:MAG: glycosyltransferase family 2 protein [Anaerolineae bacterium]